MTFTKRLREGVRSGQITCSVRIWMRPRVIVGNRYRMEEGEIVEIDSIDLIGFPDITHTNFARASGFLGLHRSAQSGQARQRRQHLPHPLPLHPTDPLENFTLKASSRGEAAKAQTLKMFVESASRF